MSYRSLNKLFNTKLFFYAGLILLIFFFMIMSFYGFIRYQINTPLGFGGEEQVFIIEKGEGVNQVAWNLEKENLIRGAFYFEMHIWFQSLEAKLQAGEYLISSRMSIKEITNMFTGGDVITNEIEITFPEGFSIKDMEARLEENGFNEVNLGRFKPIFFGSQFVFLQNILTSNLEGFLFPDTYKFDREWPSEKIAEKMLENFDKKITPDLLWDIKKQGKDLFEIVTMASLIEREVRTEEDKKIISGILWKRMRAGMPLQVDTSIVYLTGKKAGKVTYDDLKIESPYNTYLNRGLPPGPISNPGLESILAAVHPVESPFWYYLSKPTGETVFSRTLTEHNIAKAKYLK